jgi:benzoyl-CoA-dihydrodiol lyase
MASTAESGSASAITPAWIDFATHPSHYKHWQLTVHGRVATLVLNVREQATLFPGYELKRNSYDLGVDIELYDATQRLRFEHPEVAAVIITSGNPQVFCAGANIRMLAQATYEHKVNFCKFTNETRNAMEEATASSGQTYVCAMNGAASGGGYELALACAYIVLIDDGASTVSLPELPLLAVLPGTGGLTRLVDKRHVRRDHADFFCTTSEGVRGKRAVAWRLVDEVVPRSHFEASIQARAEAFAERSDRPATAQGVALSPLQRTFTPATWSYAYLTVTLDRTLSTATFMIRGPEDMPPQALPEIHAAGATFWPLALARELEDAILHLRLNEETIGTWVLQTQGDPTFVAAAEAALHTYADDWLIREMTLYLKRVLKRLEVSSRSLITLIEPGSCFHGMLLELVLAADRSFMLNGTFAGSPVPAATLRLSPLNFGALPMSNGLSRLASRFLATPEHVEELQEAIGKELMAADAEALGLVTFIPDDIDWPDEVRLALEERASFSPDALTAMEASLRFAGPETLETKIFGRLSAWQNWVFQRPNAMGKEGALPLYGTGKKSTFDKRRA